MFHPLPHTLTIGKELPERFTNPFDYLPHPLVEIARGELCAYLGTQGQWHDEIEQGKMFGVLVVADGEGELGFLAAFSGYLDKKTLHEYFVPPILDLHEPGGFFSLEEANISQINRQIAAMDSDEQMIEIRKQLLEITNAEQLEIEELRTQYLAARAHRKALRTQGCDQATLAALATESQRQKGVMRRRELHYSTLRQPLERLVECHKAARTLLVNERKSRSAALQTLTFSRFQPLNAHGEPKDLITIFTEYNNTTPPAGSGECAAPKLLHYAFSHGLKPIAMGEFWWGESTRGEVRRHMHYYPACRGKCHPILSHMLLGLEVEPPHTPEQSEQSLAEQLTTIYEDQHLVAFNKPSGLPSVRGLNHTQSVQSIAEQRYPDIDPNCLIVHRLDMDTSGVIIIAKSAECQRNLQQQFAAHTIRKRYIALVDGTLPEPQGNIDLPLALDPLDRPRQRVDHTHGKAAYTFYTQLEVKDNTTRVALYPQTGRTHQLRVHCAHHEGLNTPIVGDRLYGSPAKRLMLHAEQITLKHPETDRKFTLQVAPGF